MRLIDADAVIERLNKVYAEDDVFSQGIFCGVSYAIDVVKIAPTIDAEPVKHGVWDNSGRYKFPSGATAVRCSNCGCCLEEYEYVSCNWYYCPVCGAKMDGERKNHER